MRRTRFHGLRMRDAGLIRLHAVTAVIALLLSLGGLPPLAVQAAMSGVAIVPDNADQLAPIALYGKGTPGSVTFAPDGRTLAVNSSTGIRLYDARTLTERWFGETPGRAGVAVFAPDSTTVAAATDDGAVRLWRVTDGASLRMLALPQLSPTSPTFAFTGAVAFSPDGSLLAAGGAEGKTILWRVSDGMPLLTLTGGTSVVTNVLFSPDGWFISSATAATRYPTAAVTFNTWRVADGSLVFTSSSLSSFSSTEGLNGRAFATRVFGNATMLLWQITDGVPIQTATISPKSDPSVPHPRTTVFDVLVFSPDGAIVATREIEMGTVQLWRVADGALLQTLAVPAAEAQAANTPFLFAFAALTFSPDGTMLVMQEIGPIRIWRVTDGTLLQTIPVATYPLTSRLAVSPDSMTVASIANDGYLRLQRAADGTLLGVAGDYTRGAMQMRDLRDLALSPDGMLVASVTSEGVISIRRVTDGAVLQTLVAPGGGNYRIAFSSDGVQLVAARTDGMARIWNVHDGMLVRTLAIPCTQRFCGDLFVDVRGDLIAIGPIEQASGGPVVQLWRISDGMLLRTLPASSRTKAGSVLTLSPDGALLATILGDSGSAQVWRTTDGTLLQSLAATLPVDNCHHGYNRSAAFTSDGTTLVTTTDDMVWLWRVSDGMLFRSFPASHCVTFTGSPIPTTTTAPVTTITLSALTPDGQTLALGMTDRTLQLWRVSDGTLVRTLGPLPVPITSLTFSPDGSLLLAGFADSTVRVWGVVSGQ